MSHTDIHPAQVTTDYHAALTIGLHPPSRFWTSIHYTPHTDTYEMNQLGPRHLWDEVEIAYTRWVQAGRPPAEQWQFTITPQGQQIDLAGLRPHTQGLAQVDNAIRAVFEYSS